MKPTFNQILLQKIDAIERRLDILASKEWTNGLKPYEPVNASKFHQDILPIQYTINRLNSCIDLLNTLTGLTDESVPNNMGNLPSKIVKRNGLDSTDFNKQVK